MTTIPSFNTLSQHELIQLFWILYLHYYDRLSMCHLLAMILLFIRKAR